MVTLLEGIATIDEQMLILLQAERLIFTAPSARTIQRDAPAAKPATAAARQLRRKKS
jgi:hypothetical protein